jgi:bisphosphoglycerate-independent phosphoglycerate mutase (AlkP superfamily)
MKSSDLNKKKIILIFIDGLGIGDHNPDYNPCFYSETGIFDPGPLPVGGVKLRLDANLDVDGLPQSATGQTSIYTGINAAKLIQRHLFGFPNQQLREVIQEKSLFVKLTNSGYSCKFLNAFRPVFFTTPEIFKDMRMSVTPEMNRAAGLPFSSLEDIKHGKALYHDYSNQVLRDLHFDIPRFTASDAAKIILDASSIYDLVLYEYFETDRAGHYRNLDVAIREIKKLEKLINELIFHADFNNTTLAIISDHGNIEDLRTKSHTRNPAYCAIWQMPPNGVAGKMRSIGDMYEFVLGSIIHSTN